MKINELTLYTNDLASQKEFYANVLGFQLMAVTDSKFSVKIGFTKLSFEYAAKDYKYHYCFLIPSNKLSSAVAWLKQRLEIIKIDDNMETQFFESWNAESVYFYDGTGNVAEFIVRYDLDNDCNNVFTNKSIISVNEIGTPSKTINVHGKLLHDNMQLKLWKGNYERFACNGTQNGLFLLVNNELKKYWFPTDVETQSSPYNASIFNNGKLYNVVFKNGELTCGYV